MISDTLPAELNYLGSLTSILPAPTLPTLADDLTIAETQQPVYLPLLVKD